MLELLSFTHTVQMTLHACPMGAPTAVESMLAAVAHSANKEERGNLV